MFYSTLTIERFNLLQFSSIQPKTPCSVFQVEETSVVSSLSYVLDSMKTILVMELFSEDSKFC
jgi:pyruvoyl-dependent arginine decarboxylase (PvlArgDC)